MCEPGVRAYTAISANSCGRQERDLRGFAKRAGHKIVAVFKEMALGGRQRASERTKILVPGRAASNLVGNWASVRRAVEFRNQARDDWLQQFFQSADRCLSYGFGLYLDC
jgi:hypothetical protein